jgi:hypothetical protein
MPRTCRFRSAINVAPCHGTAVTLDSDNEANPAPEVVVIAGTAALVATAGTCFILENEAKADNIARALGAAAKSVFESSILAGAAIAFGRGPELHGCTLAQSAVIFVQTGGSC